MSNHNIAEYIGYTVASGTCELTAPQSVALTLHYTKKRYRRGNPGK